VTVITGHGADEVETALGASAGGQFALNFVRQEPQLGTGHAVQQAVPALRDDGVVVILSGDVPLTQADTLQQLIAASAGTRLALLTIDFANPAGYGRIVRSGDAVRAIVEQKDATPEQRAITEVYSGIMAVPSLQLKRWLARLDKHNAQGEYYLTQIIKFAVADGVPVVAHKITDAVQVAGVNSPVQLAELERAYQQRLALALMEQGVRVGANCVIRNASIATGAVIHPFTHIEGGKPGTQDAVEVGAGALIGPFAHLRPGARLEAEVHIGNFVEVKNSTLARGAKANHLAYLGDATVGERVNYGAGSITANYDGAFKHRTIIEADVHIGSNCVLIAPVTIGAGGTVGGGSTLTQDTAPRALTVARARQISIPNWQRPSK
jgi:bifunctional UDP-N-acetylglucosamine pyrophosphorylase/glucosamine-1-phosphate N-acetyltransferase